MTVAIAAVFASGFCIFEVFILPQKCGFEAASGHTAFMSNYIKIHSVVFIESCGWSDRCDLGIWSFYVLHARNLQYPDSTYIIL
jgi:hypothetical protein